MNSLVTIDSVKSSLIAVRGQMALLDRDVAALYGEVKVLKSKISTLDPASVCSQGQVI